MHPTRGTRIHPKGLQSPLEGGHPTERLGQIKAPFAGTICSTPFLHVLLPLGVYALGRQIPHVGLCPREVSMTTMQKARIAGRAHWLVVKHLSSRMDVFTTHLCGDAKALVVFSFQEEAEMFLKLRLTASKDGWRVRQTSVGELVSVLYGPCSDTRKVVLDPLPEIGKEELARPLSIHRNDFLRFLLGEGTSDLHLVPSQAYKP